MPFPGYIFGEKAVSLMLDAKLCIPPPPLLIRGGGPLCSSLITVLTTPWAEIVVMMGLTSLADGEETELGIDEDGDDVDNEDDDGIVVFRNVGGFDGDMHWSCDLSDL